MKTNANHAFRDTFSDNRAQDARYQNQDQNFSDVPVPGAPPTPIRVAESASSHIEKIAERFFPNGVPFPKERLALAGQQMIQGREQWLDYNGSFVATDPALLPKGGQRIERTTDHDQLNIAFVADMGDRSEQQDTVFRGLSKHISERPDKAHLIVGGGDWVYPHGPKDDSESERARIADTVLTRTKSLAQQAPVIAALGNHEYGDYTGPSDVAQFMDLARAHDIEIPGRYFHHEIGAINWGVDIIVVDSSVIASDPEQQDWIAKTVEASLEKESLEKESGNHCPRWRVLVSHHPLQSYGYHGDENEFLQTLLEKPLRNIDLVLSGHEHDVQFLSGKPGCLPPTLICGTASTSRTAAGVEGGEYSEFCSLAASYATLEFDRDAIDLSVQQVDKINDEVAATKTFTRKISRPVADMHI